MTMLFVAFGAAFGAPLRYAAAQLFDASHDVNRWPWGTMVVNVFGSWLFGFCLALTLGEYAWAFLGVGFSGGLTTYSGFATQTADRMREPSTRLKGLAYAVCTVALSLAACIGGYALA